MEIKYEEKEIIQTLKDAGCDDETIDRLIEKYEEGKEKECLFIIEKHRNCLMEQLHQGQKNIDCLDYLVYKVKKIRSKVK